MIRIHKSSWQELYQHPCPEHFTSFYRESRALVYTLCARILHDPEDILDAFQGTYVRILTLARDTQRAEKIHDAADMVCRLSVREADALRHRISRRRKKEAAMGERDVASTNQMSPEMMIDRKQVRQCVMALVGSLPDKYRLPLLLHYFDGMTHKEVAASLGVSRATVSNRLARAVKKLKPLVRRNGFGETSSVLAGIMMQSGLLEPPPAVSAEAVFAKAVSVLSKPGAAATAAKAGAPKTAIGGAGSAGAAAAVISFLKTNAAMVTLAALFTSAVLVSGYYFVLNSNDLLVSRKEGDVVPHSEKEGGVSGKGREAAVSGETRHTAENTEPGADSATGTAVFGKVFFHETGQPAAGAEVMVFPPGGPSCTSKSDGSYELAGVKGASVMFGAILHPYLSHLSLDELTPVSIEEGKRNGPFDLTLVRGLTLEGQVTASETGEPVSEAEVESRLFETRTATTDADGLFRFEGFPAMQVPVSVYKKGYARYRTNYHIRRDADNSCDIALGPGGTVHVNVVDENDQPVPEATVGFCAGDSTILHTADNAGDQKSRFILEGVCLDQPVEIRAFKDGYKQVEKVVPEFPHSGREVSVVVRLAKKKTEQKQYVFTGCVRDYAGAPISGATVGWADRSRPNAGKEQVKTDENGCYVLSVLRPDSYKQISAWKKGYAPDWERSIAPGPQRRPSVVDFVLGKEHRLEVKIVDETGAPLPGVFLCPLLASDDVAHTTYEIPGLCGRINAAQTGADGICRLSGLPPEEVLLDLWRFGLTEISRMPLQVDQAIAITMKKAGVIRGTVVDAESRTPVSRFVVKVSGGGIASSRRTEGQMVSDPDGRFLLHELNQGKAYDIAIEAEGYPLFSLSDVKAKAPDDQGETVCALSLGAAVAGKIVDAHTSAPIPGASVISLASRYSLPTWEGIADRGNSFHESRIETGTDQHGGFQLQEGTKPGYLVINLFIFAEGYERCVIRHVDRKRYYEGESTLLKVPLEPQAVLEGKVVFHDKPIGGAKLRARAVSVGKRGMSYDLGTIAADEEGAFAITNLEKGAYRLSVYKTKGRVSFSWLSMPLTISSGEHKNVMIGKELGRYSIEGCVKFSTGEPAAETRVTVVPSFSWPYSELAGYTDQEGRYTISGVPSGTFKITASKRIYPAEGGSREFTAKRTITCNGNTACDLVFPKKHAVRAAFIFEGAPLTDGSFSRAHVELLHLPDSYRVNDTTHPRYSGTARIIDNRIELEGWFRGDYTFRLDYSFDSSFATYFHSSELALDTTESDQNLGTLSIPRPGGFSLKGTVRRADDTPVPKAGVALFPRFASDYRSFRATADGTGRFRIDGLRSGSCKARISIRGEGGGYRETVEIIQIAGETSHDFVLPMQHTISGSVKVTMPDAMQSAYELEKLLFHHVEWDGGRPVSDDGISFYVTGHVENSRFSCRARCAGLYHVISVFQKSETGERITLPLGTWEIDSTKEDQELGELACVFPSFGACRITTSYEDRKDPEDAYLSIYFFPEGTRTCAMRRGGRGTSFEAEAIPEGTYDVTVYAAGAACDPAFQKVVIDGNRSLDIAWNVAPRTLLKGRVNEKGSYDPAAIRRVMLKGPETRILVPGQEKQGFSPYYRRLFAREDALGDGWFAFVDLREGDYRVTIETESFGTASGEVEVRKNEQSSLRFLVERGR